MSIHVFGAIITTNGCAANNRGETEGNITTLQKLLWQGQVHTTVSAEAIRWAIRYYWQLQGKNLNRSWNDELNTHQWENEDTSRREKHYIDDDVLGYMTTEGAKGEKEKEVQREEKKQEDAKEKEKQKEKKKNKKKKKEKGKSNARRGVLEVSRAISTTAYSGDISFNSKSGEKDRTSLYGTEIHCTRYQYGFAITPERLHNKEHCIATLEAIASLGQVAGNHSRFLYDFSPESIIIRITHDPAPRILYCFEEQDGKISSPSLLHKIISKDIDPDELYIGGEIATQIESLLKKEKDSQEQLPKAAEEEQKLYHCSSGIKETIKKVCKDLREKLKLESTNG